MLTDMSRLARIARYKEEDTDLIRILPRVVPAEGFIHRDRLLNTLAEDHGLYHYTKGSITRRLKDLGYSVTRRKVQGTRRNCQGVSRKADGYIFGPDWETGRLRWLNPEDAAKAWDAPHEVKSFAPMAARSNKELSELEGQAPDLSKLGITI